MEPKRELTFEQTLAILAHVPKDEVEEIESERLKRTAKKPKRNHSRKN